MFQVRKMEGYQQGIDALMYMLGVVAALHLLKKERIKRFKDHADSAQNYFN